MEYNSDSDSEEEANKNVIDYLKDFTAKSLRVCDNRWKEMMDFDKNKTLINGFMNKNQPQVQFYVYQYQLFDSKLLDIAR